MHTCICNLAPNGYVDHVTVTRSDGHLLFHSVAQCE